MLTKVYHASYGEMMSVSIKALAEDALQDRLADWNAVMGGYTNDVYRARDTEHGQILIKASPQAPDAFLSEAAGLEAIAAAKGPPVPGIVYADRSILIMEYIEPSQRTAQSFKGFGRSLANQHRHRSSFWGLDHDNYCGMTRQKNTPLLNAAEYSWSHFYFEYRLGFQMALAKKNGLADTALVSAFERLNRRRDDLIPADGEPPCLLHGDLWSGNYIIGPQGDVFVIDPAVYYGHREADLAIATLFGGFPQEFFDSYNEVYPLAADWKQRQPLYQLYHLLNHMNLMGGGYYGQALAAIHHYLC